MRDIVVIGASAGGVAALRRLTQGIPASLPAALIVAMHRSSPQSAIADILGKTAHLPVQWATDGQKICAAKLYLAPPDHQMRIDCGFIRVDKSPREGLYRPSINLLFRSAAAEYGKRVIGVILTGSLNDGTAGLWEIKRRGGVAVVQEPSEAAFDPMPTHAIENVSVDFVLPIDGIAQKLIELTQEHTSAPGPGRPANVLIVEDEVIAATALEESLRILGHEVSAAVASAEDALRVARSRPPDLVLMDIQLSGPMTGIQAARRLWEQFQIPTVYVTAFADSVVLDQLNGAGCYGYVAKPFHAKAVHAAVELALKRRQKELQRL